MSKKVYVVTEGCYSDYHIEVILTNIKQARNYIINHSDEYTGYQIEEYELDDEYPETNDKLYDVIRRANGEWNIKDAEDWYGNVNEKARISCDIYAVPPRHTYHNYIHARDEEHALKIAQDDYAMLKAREEGL